LTAANYIDALYDLCVFGGNDLTGEEMKALVEMFVSQRSYEEREKNFTDAIDKLTDASAAMSLLVAELHGDLSDHNARLKIIEACHNQQQKMYTLKIAGAALIVSIISQLHNIIRFFQGIVK
jgi:hypothetical protein